jgi:hypothetical protein
MNGLIIPFISLIMNYFVFAILNENLQMEN